MDSPSGSRVSPPWTRGFGNYRKSLSKRGWGGFKVVSFQGCDEGFKNWVKGNVAMVGGVGVGIAFIQVRIGMPECPSLSSDSFASSSVGTKSFLVDCWNCLVLLLLAGTEKRIRSCLRISFSGSFHMKSTSYVAENFKASAKFNLATGLVSRFVAKFV